MAPIHIVILAIVQGISEFLPISSSGHLVVADALLEAMGYTPPEELVEVSIVLHLGTLASILLFYWHRVRRLLGRDVGVIALLVVGTLPAVVFGLACKIYLPHVLESVLVAGLMFPVTAGMLIWATRHLTGTTDYSDLGYGQAFLIGLFQAAAILPGISRSGATIVAGLATGMTRTSSATFAFLLAIPAISGAGVLEALDMLEAGRSSTAPGLLLLGFVISMIVGYSSLWLLIRMVERGSLYLFASWLIPLGIAVTTWQLLSGK